MKCPDCGEVMQLVHRQLNLGLYNRELEAYHKRLTEANQKPIFTRAIERLFPPRINQYWFDTYHCKTCDWKWTKKA